MKNKNALIALVILVVLALLFGVTLFFFMKDNEDNVQQYEKREIAITINGERKVYTFEELTEISQPVDFKAIYKPSNKEPIEKTYTGIELKELLEKLGADLENMNQVTFTAKDGFQKVYRADDVRKEDNVYVAYLVNGKPFNEGIDAKAYEKEQEDGGPYVVIKAEDQVSQNRVKMLVEIVVE